MSGPLEGIRVVDLTQVVSGPLATMLLADQGAEVVKVEPSGIGGDVTRLPSFAKGGISALFVNNNRGKRSLAVDLTNDEGRQIIIDLVAKADVFIQNFRPGAIERLGLGYEELKAVNPELIYCSISGFGPDGPYSDRPVLDPVIQGLTSMVSRQLNPQIPFPDLVRNLVADKSTAFTSAQAITAALFSRERTGKGQYLQIPMLDSCLYFFWVDGMMDLTMMDEDVSPGLRLSQVYSITNTADGQLVYFAANDKQRFGLLRALGRDELCEDERFSSLAAISNPENFAALGEIVAKEFEKVTNEEIIPKLIEHEVPCGPILDGEETIEDPQVIHNEVLRVWEHQEAGKIRQPVPAARFSETPAEMRETAALLGQHNDEILEELKRDRETIERLREEGVIL
ncbi:MAG: CoA transferase [Acidimicrobiales bacterium]|jgi:crotonobetainyl-CoA:carnitine CoA-transferase CaiB-like acyl-CoA transferase|nr:CoA transferase [Acidimicrobiales bacterium]MDP6893761.1 CoA transferase [Acidimicrobiales bacterium]HJM37481.1 CoA transferase [Acidimicrobiales bacterium]|tara:strand:- start:518 stop:1711 length:1194 start_codon:yes stop_codon:yes gene_type:complete